MTRDSEVVNVDAGELRHVFAALIRARGER